MRTTDFQNSTAAASLNTNQGFVSLSHNPESEICPLRRLIRQWLISCRADGLAAKTIDDYREKIFKFVWWWSDGTTYAKEAGAHPKNVTKREIKEFLAYLREPRIRRWGEPVRKGKEQLSPASIAAYGRTLKVFFNWLVREEEIDLSPVESVKFTPTNKERSRIIKTVSDDNLLKLFAYLTRPDELAHYEGVRNLAIVALLLDSGMRRGELLSIRLQDVDLEHYRIKISGKTGERYAHFSKSCVPALREYLKLREQQQALYHELRQNKHAVTKQVSVRKFQARFSGARPNNLVTLAPAETDNLWLAADGRPLEPYGFNTLIRRIRERAGLSQFHAHQLRHTFATKLAASNIDIFSLKELMGHQSIKTTEIYVQQNDELLAEAYRQRSPLANLGLGTKVKRGK